MYSPRPREYASEDKAIRGVESIPTSARPAYRGVRAGSTSERREDRQGVRSRTDALHPPSRGATQPQSRGYSERSDSSGRHNKYDQRRPDSYSRMSSPDRRLPLSPRSSLKPEAGKYSGRYLSSDHLPRPQYSRANSGSGDFEIRNSRSCDTHRADARRTSIGDHEAPFSSRVGRSLSKSNGSFQYFVHPRKPARVQSHAEHGQYESQRFSDGHAVPRISGDASRTSVVPAGERSQPGAGAGDFRKQSAPQSNLHRDSDPRARSEKSKVTSRYSTPTLPFFYTEGVRKNPDASQNVSTRPGNPKHRELQRYGSSPGDSGRASAHQGLVPDRTALSLASKAELHASDAAKTPSVADNACQDAKGLMSTSAHSAHAPSAYALRDETEQFRAHLVSTERERGWNSPIRRFPDPRVGKDNGRSYREYVRKRMVTRFTIIDREEFGLENNWKRYSSRSAVGRGKYTVFISHLNDNITEEFLSRELSLVAPVLSVEIPLFKARRSGLAKATFKSDCSPVIKEFNGRVLMGKALTAVFDPFARRFQAAVAGLGKVKQPDEQLPASKLQRLPVEKAPCQGIPVKPVDRHPAPNGESAAPHILQAKTRNPQDPSIAVAAPVTRRVAQRFVSAVPAPRGGFGTRIGDGSRTALGPRSDRHRIDDKRALGGTTQGCLPPNRRERAGCFRAEGVPALEIRGLPKNFDQSAILAHFQSAHAGRVVTRFAVYFVMFDSLQDRDFAAKQTKNRVCNHLVHVRTCNFVADSTGVVNDLGATQKGVDRNVAPFAKEDPTAIARTGHSTKGPNQETMSRNVSGSRAKPGALRGDCTSHKNSLGESEEVLPSSEEDLKRKVLNTAEKLIEEELLKMYKHLYAVECSKAVRERLASRDETGSEQGRGLDRNTHEPPGGSFAKKAGKSGLLSTGLEEYFSKDSADLFRSIRKRPSSTSQHPADPAEMDGPFRVKRRRRTRFADRSKMDVEVDENLSNVGDEEKKRSSDQVSDRENVEMDSDENANKHDDNRSSTSCEDVVPESLTTERKRPSAGQKRRRILLDHDSSDDDIEEIELSMRRARGSEGSPPGTIPDGDTDFFTSSEEGRRTWEEDEDLTKIDDVQDGKSLRSDRSGDGTKARSVTPVEETFSCARCAGYTRKDLRERRGLLPQPQRHSKELVDDGTVVAMKSSRESRQYSRRYRQEVNNLQPKNDMLSLNFLCSRKKKVRFDKSKIHGMGLFALESIESGEFIIEYVGEVIRRSVSDVRERLYVRQGIGDSYLFRLSNERVVDATRRGSVARFINHSCDPNVIAKIITVGGESKIAFYAFRDIAAKTELTYDYKFAVEADEDMVICLCGAANCRQRLN